MSIEVVAAIKRRLNQHREAEIDYVATGKPKDWGEYKKRVGAITGLDWALAIADEETQRLIADPDADDGDLEPMTEVTDEPAPAG